MKKIIFILVLLLPIISFANPDEVHKNKQKTSTTSSSFTGRIINISNNQVEVKKGSFEITFQFADTTQVEKDTKQLTVKDLKICQMVKIEYIKNETVRTISKITIVQESYCSE